MLLLYVLLLVAASVGTCSAIVYGKIADIEKYPFIVRLSIEKRKQINETWYRVTSRCGGTIVTPKTVLSAAHCFRDADDIDPPEDLSDITDIEFSCGHSNWENGHKIKWNEGHLMLHEDYNRETYDDDLALVWTLQEFPIDGFRVAIGRLPIKGPSEFAMAEYAGWGVTEYIVKTLNLVEGNGYFNKTSPREWKLYMPSPNSQMAGCTGDSGGPLVQNDIIIGVSSFVSELDENYHFKDYRRCIGAKTSFTNIHYYLTWINTYKNRETRPEV